jgi:serine/threonine protein kinase
LIGSGAFGQVRLCYPVDDFKKKYAVKFIDKDGDLFRNAAGHLNARQEALILQAVAHPYVVKLLDVYEEDRWLFMVMEYIPGGELFAAYGNPKLSVAESSLAAVGKQLFQALGHIHERGICHRDVKAENLLLSSDPSKTGNWTIKLIDFGLAIQFEQEQTNFLGIPFSNAQDEPLGEFVCGTAYYCSPEVWMNEYSPCVDIWAAGVVLYMALFGTFPFCNSDPNVLEGMICDLQCLPRYEPVKAAECAGYSGSKEARRCLEALLIKDGNSRPSAERALVQPWFNVKSYRPFFDGSTEKHGKHNRSSSTASDCHLLSTGDQPIPAAIRARAARAAERPPVDIATELARTAALKDLQARGKAVALKRSVSTASDAFSDASSSFRTTAKRFRYSANSCAIFDTAFRLLD